MTVAYVRGWFVVTCHARSQATPVDCSDMGWLSLRGGSGLGQADLGDRLGPQQLALNLAKCPKHRKRWGRRPSPTHGYDHTRARWLRRRPESNRRIKVLQTSALPLGYAAKDGAESGIRTRDPQLGKLLLYQLSYFRFTTLLHSLATRHVLSRRTRLGGGHRRNRPPAYHQHSSRESMMARILGVGVVFRRPPRSESPVVCAASSGWSRPRSPANRALPSARTHRALLPARLPRQHPSQSG
jgi:hypothetical protein